MNILKNINSQNQQQENSLSQVIYLMSQIYWFFIYYIYFDVVTSKDAFSYRLSDNRVILIIFSCYTQGKGIKHKKET